MLISSAARSVNPSRQHTHAQWARAFDNVHTWTPPCNGSELAPRQIYLLWCHPASDFHRSYPLSPTNNTTRTTITPCTMRIGNRRASCRHPGAPKMFASGRKSGSLGNCSQFQSYFWRRRSVMSVATSRINHSRDRQIGHQQLWKSTGPNLQRP